MLTLRTCEIYFLLETTFTNHKHCTRMRTLYHQILLIKLTWSILFASASESSSLSKMESGNHLYRKWSTIAEIPTEVANVADFIFPEALEEMYSKYPHLWSVAGHNQTNNDTMDDFKLPEPIDPSNVMKSRIVGGSVLSNETSHRFHVSIINRKYRHYCGGSIIGTHWILTSAHCKTACDKRELCAVRYATLELGKGRVAPIRLFIAHKGYMKTPKIDNDIALVEAPLILDEMAQPIPLLPRDVPFGEEMEVEGWGWTEIRYHTCATHLKVAHVQRVGCPVHVSRFFFCAVGTDSNPCHGDSGGSVVYKDMLAGLVGASVIKKNTGGIVPSFRCKANNIITYTYSYKYMDWINEMIENVSKMFYKEMKKKFRKWSDKFVRRTFKRSFDPAGC